MAYEEQLKSISRPAAGDLSANQYKIVQIDSSGNVALAAEGVSPVGVLQNAPAAAGRAATVGVEGVSKVLCGGAISKGARVTCNSTGLAVAIGSGDDFSIGVALETGANGVIIACLLQPTGFHAIAGVIP